MALLPQQAEPVPFQFAVPTQSSQMDFDEMSVASFEADDDDDLLAADHGFMGGSMAPQVTPSTLIGW